MSTITIRNVTVKDNGRLLNNATLSGSSDVLVDSASIEGNAVALENHVFEMSPDEYARFEELLQKGKGSKATFLTSLRQHLSNFAVGVAANVLSAYISKGL